MREQIKTNGGNHVKNFQSADFTLKGVMCGNTEKSMLDPEKAQRRIKLKKTGRISKSNNPTALKQFINNPTWNPCKIYAFMCITVLHSATAFHTKYLFI
jgi:hypothetical protein